VCKSNNVESEDQMLVIELFFAAPTDAVFCAGYDETEKKSQSLVRNWVVS
jgi:hypothetical protein